MAAAIGWRVALAVILLPVVAASSGGDAISDSLFAGITPLLGLFGQDFSNHYLRQSTSWLDSVVFAVGPLGIPTAIIAAIRVKGSKFLKGAIGQAREADSGIEKDLLSSTSDEVCEMWDGKQGEWYDLRSALKMKKLQNSDPRRRGDEEMQMVAQDKAPPNLLLNLIPEDRYWELPAAAILGVPLQLTVLIIAGLTTFYPPWKDQFSIAIYEFYCTAAGTVLLTLGLFVCALVVDYRTKEDSYEIVIEDSYGNKVKGGSMCVVWLQRSRSETDKSFKSYILSAERKKLRTSRRAQGSQPYLEAWTLVGALATMVGYVVQFIGLIGMHWPTQVAQFAVTLIMIGVRAYIRRAPPSPRRAITSQRTSLPRLLREGLHDKHDMDWLANNFPENICNDESTSRVWQMMNAESLGDFQKPEPSLLTGGKNLFENGGGAGLKGRGGRSNQALLIMRQQLGTLCEWTGPVRKWAISVANAIDEVMNTLDIKPESGQVHPVFQWPLDAQADKVKQRVWFTIHYDNGRWKSVYAQIEAALSLGLFGVDRTTSEDNKLRNADNTKGDWLRLDEEKTPRETSMTLLGPYEATSRRDLLWWLGPKNGKLKEVSLRMEGSLMIKYYYPTGLEGSRLMSDDLTVERHRIAGFGCSWQVNGDSSDDPLRCLAAVSEAELGLLFARHMFQAFMWTVVEQNVKWDTKSYIVNKWAFVPYEEDSWNSLELRDDTVKKLAQCVQRAELGDIEDAYLAVIPPLNKKGMLPYPLEVFDIAWNSAIEEQRQGNWENAYEAYRLLFRNFMTFGGRNILAIKATALLTELFMLLSATLTLQEGRVMERDDNEVSMLKTLKTKALEHLDGADQDTMKHLRTLYTMQGRFEDCKELRVNKMVQLTQWIKVEDKASTLELRRVLE